MIKNGIHVDWERFSKVHQEASGGDAGKEQELIELFYGMSYKYVHWNYRDQNHQTKEDLIQSCVIECYTTYQKKEFHGEPIIAPNYYNVIIKRVCCHAVLECVSENVISLEEICTSGDGNSREESTELLDAFSAIEDEATSLVSQKTLLNYVYKKCSKKIRFSGNERKLCLYILWMLIYDKNDKNKTLIRKSISLNLRDRFQFLRQYCRIHYRIMVRNIIDSKITMERMLNEI